MFRVGQPVTLVKEPGNKCAGWASFWKIVRPSYGVVYSVREVRCSDAGQFIRLVEIVNPPAPFKDACTQEPWWPSAAFRHVVERKTDISVFTEILRRASSPTPAPVEGA